LSYKDSSKKTFQVEEIVSTKNRERMVWNLAIKFAWWQHPAMGHGASFDVHDTT